MCFFCFFFSENPFCFLGIFWHYFGILHFLQTICMCGMRSSIAGSLSCHTSTTRSIRKPENGWNVRGVRVGTSPVTCHLTSHHYLYRCTYDIKKKKRSSASFLFFWQRKGGRASLGPRGTYHFALRTIISFETNGGKKGRTLRNHGRITPNSQGSRSPAARPLPHSGAVEVPT